MQMENFQSNLEDLVKEISAGILKMEEEEKLENLFFAAPFFFEDNLYTLRVKNSSRKKNEKRI
jgi:hypothetical protein